MAASSTRRSRRSTDEVRRLILKAATESFREQGYVNARTKEIADRAGVAETVLFRHFGSKPELFEQAVIGVVEGFLREHFERWRDFYAMPHDVRQPATAWIAKLYDLLYANRGLMKAYLSAASSGGPDGLSAVVGHDQLGQVLRPLDELATREVAAVGLVGIDIPVSIRAAFGMLLSFAVYGDLLFPGGRRPSRQRIVDECTSLLMDGWAHRGNPAANGTGG